MDTDSSDVLEAAASEDAQASYPIWTPHAVACPSCGEMLDLIQPDEDYPHRLLGTCPDCRRTRVVLMLLGDAIVATTCVFEDAIRRRPKVVGA